VSQQLLEVSAFCPHACAKTSTPLVNCIVNDGLVNAMPNMQKTVSVHNTCLDKSVCYFQRIFNRNRKLKQQVSKLSAVKLNVCSQKSNYVRFCLHFLPDILKLELLTFARYAATYWSGKYYINFVWNLRGFPTIKEFWKSVKNWQSYRHDFGVLLFGTQCIMVNNEQFLQVGWLYRALMHAWFSYLPRASVSSVFMVLYYFCLHPFLYLLVSNGPWMVD